MKFLRVYNILYILKQEKSKIWTIKNGFDQGCKMDCENCDNCEIVNCDCDKNTISQITQFDFLEGRNRERYQNYYIEEFSFEKWVNSGWILDLQNCSNLNSILG